MPNFSYVSSSKKVNEIEAKTRLLKQVKKCLEKMMKEIENGLECELVAGLYLPDC